MNERIGRRLAATSLVALLVVSGLVVSGALIAWADTAANLVPPAVDTSAWSPPSGEPSGAAWIDPGAYLFVVDTNVNDPGGNGWQYDIQGEEVTNRPTGVEEPTGIDYDPDSNTLFISQDDGHMFVFENFDTLTEVVVEIDVSSDSFDVEDPAYHRADDLLYWVDGAQSLMFELDPVNGIWGDSGDQIRSFSLSTLNSASNADWEGLAWDPRTGNLLVGNRFDELIYEITINGSSINLINTIVATGVPGLEWISGMGMAPASYDSAEMSLWVTDRSTSSLYELTIDGTTPPTTIPTTPSSSTSSSSSSTTTTITSITTTTTPNNPPPDPDPDLEFDDIAGSVFANSIQWLAAEGITQGCNPPANTRFCPEQQVTRAQMATFLVRAQGLPAYNGPDRFRDDDGTVFEGAIERLAQAGITVGCNPPTNDRFCPDDLVTRGQMAAFLGRAFDYTDAGSGDWFIDDNSSVFENAIDKLRVAGITLGCNPPDNDRYCPETYVTRGQMAAFLKRALGE